MLILIIKITLYNLFQSACKLRFDLNFYPFDPVEIARKTERGLFMVNNNQLYWNDNYMYNLFGFYLLLTHTLPLIFFY